MISRIGYIASWQNRLRSRLYLKNRGKKNWTALADLIAAQGQDLEDAAQSILAILSIDDAQGLMLRLIGRVIGQPYNGEDDPTYRLRLKARVLVNLSSGTILQLLAIFKLVWAGKITPVEFFPAGIMILLGDPGITDPTTLGVYVDFLRSARDGGVRGLLQYQPDTDEKTFCFENYPLYLSAPYVGDSSTIQVTPTDNLSSWPPSGYLYATPLIEPGSVTVTAKYTSISPSGVITFDPSFKLADNHDIGTELVPIGTTYDSAGDQPTLGTGGGFAESVYLSTASSVGDTSLGITSGLTSATQWSSWTAGVKVIFGPGTPTEETATIATCSLIGTSLTVTAPLEFAHSQYTQICLSSDQDPLPPQPALGGRLSGVIEA